MAGWQDSVPGLQPDGVPSWQTSVPGIVADPAVSGQQAAQSADVKPIDAPPPPELPAPPPEAPPAALSTQEPAVQTDAQFVPNRQLSARFAGPNDSIGFPISDAAAYKAKTDAISATLPEGTTLDASKGLPGFGANMETSLILRNATSRAAYLKSQGLDATVVTPKGMGPMVLWKQPGENTYHPIVGEDSGAAGDTGRIVGESLPTTAQLALSFTGGSIPIMAARAAALGSAMRGATNAVGDAQGYQPMTGVQNLADSAKTGLIDSASMAALPVGLKTLIKLPGIAGAAAGGIGNVAKSIGGPPAEAIASKLGPLLADESSGAPGAGTPIAGIPDSLSDIITKLFTKDQGSAPFKGSEAAQALNSAAREENLPSPTAAQLESAGGGGGLVAARTQQVLSTNPALRERVMQPQRDAIYDNLIANRNALTGTQSPPELSDDTISSLLSKYMSEVQSSSGVTNPGVSTVEGGTAARDAVASSVPTTAKTVGNAYDALGSAGADKASYNLTPAQEAIVAAQKGVPVKGVETQTPSAILDSDGTPLTINKALPDASAVPTPESNLAALFKNIMTRDPNIAPYKGSSGFGAVRGYRTQLGDYENQNYQNLDATARQQVGIARGVRSALTDVLENPTGGVPDTDIYKAALADAQKANVERETYLGNPKIQSTLNTSNPEEVMRYAKPGNSTFLTQLTKYGDPAKVQTFRDAFKTGLLADPTATASKLDAFKEDPDSLNALMPDPTEQQGVRDLAAQFNSITNSDLAKLSGDTALANRLPSLFSKDPDALARAVAIQGGPDSEFGRSARAAVVQHLLNESSTTYAGRDTIDSRKFASAASSLQRVHALDGIMTPQEISSLSNYVTYAKGISGSGEDNGTSLMKGGMARGLGEWLFPPTLMKHLGEAGFNAIQARTLTSPTVANLLYGGAATSTPNQAARVAASLLGGTLSDMRQQEPVVRGGSQKPQ